MDLGCSRNRGVECRDCRSARLVNASRGGSKSTRHVVIPMMEIIRVGQANGEICLGSGEWTSVGCPRSKIINDTACESYDV